MTTEKNKMEEGNGDLGAFPQIRAKLAFFERNGSVVKVVDPVTWETRIVFNARYCASVSSRPSLFNLPEVVVAFENGEKPFLLNTEEYARVLVTTPQNALNAFLEVIELAMTASGGQQQQHVPRSARVIGREMPCAKPSDRVIVCTKDEFGATVPVNPRDWDALSNVFDEIDRRRRK